MWGVAGVGDVPWWGCGMRCVAHGGDLDRCVKLSSIIRRNFPETCDGVAPCSMVPVGKSEHTPTLHRHDSAFGGALRSDVLSQNDFGALGLNWMVNRRLAFASLLRTIDCAADHASSKLAALGFQTIPLRRSLKLHKAALAGFAAPFSLLAPSLRLGPNRLRALAKASFTKSLLPITAPSVK